MHRGSPCCGRSSVKMAGAQPVKPRLNRASLAAIHLVLSPSILLLFIHHRFLPYPYSPPPLPPHSSLLSHPLPLSPQHILFPLTPSSP